MSHFEVLGMENFNIKFWKIHNSSHSGNTALYFQQKDESGKKKLNAGIYHSPLKMLSNIN